MPPAPEFRPGDHVAVWYRSSAGHEHVVATCSWDAVGQRWWYRVVRCDDDQQSALLPAAGHLWSWRPPR